ncbi:uncharacterized protein cusr [Antennarius striatus]|uniref:uncharacterized protein cusr n=1 Tax=Antennarius striatus TaxID=241820 RepID=UPI0035B38674
MILLTAALIILAFSDSVSCILFEAPFNMGGVKGEVQFNSTNQSATIMVSGAGSCSSVNLSISEFPVKYGHFAQPCTEANIGSSIFTFMADPTSNSTVSVSGLFADRSNLDDYSLTLYTCNGNRVCTVISQSQTIFTSQARFTGPIAGNLYIRRNENQPNHRILVDLITIGQVNAVQSNTTLYGSTSTFPSCSMLLNNLDASLLTNLSVVKVGIPSMPAKSRVDLNNFDTSTTFLLIKMGPSYNCARIYNVPEKQVSAVMNMRGIRGYISFRQASPFSVTEMWVNLTNLRSRVSTYHVHLFPILSISSSQSSLCSNDNVGGHWNPFGLDINDPTYPSGPGSTHDNYEVGDISTKHMSLAGQNEVSMTFKDFNLPLFGNHSIVGRSIVIHRSTDGSRYLCASISYPGEVVVGRARLQGLIIGDIYFTQLQNNPLSDVSIFMDLAYSNATMASTTNHNYHIHNYPIGSENDNDENRCSTTGPHWNPFNVNTTDISYSMYCSSSLPIACEVGDLSNKLGPVNFGPNVGSVEAKYFFTDVTSHLLASGIIGRSIVFHEEERGPTRIACANITKVRVPRANLGPWKGPGMITGQIYFSQAVPQGPTTINVSLMNLNFSAGGYHVHVLPIIPGSADPCSNANILGHYNPFNFNISESPEPGVGTVDQYEIGDLSGKFGTLNGLDESLAVFMDPYLPLSGPYSVVGRSIVVHYPNGSRLQCANIISNKSSEAHLITAQAVFSGSVNGTVKLNQQMFTDGSTCDVIIEINLQTLVRETEMTLSLLIQSMGQTTTQQQCGNLGSVYNPFNMASMSPSCSVESQLSCVPGEISARHGNISLNQRMILTDSIIILSGDNTIVGRSLLLMNGSTVIDCADIMPVSSSASLTFLTMDNFSRPAIRSYVASKMSVDKSRVTILAGYPVSAAGGRCQTVKFLVAGNVNETLLASIGSEAGSPFGMSDVCSSGIAGVQQVSGSLLLGLFALSFLLPMTAGL